MTKKEYILKMLDLIKDIFPPAKDFKVLVEGDVVGDEMIDTLVAMLKEVRASITDLAQQEKLDKSVDFLEKLKQVEVAEHAKDTERLKELEELFKTI